MTRPPPPGQQDPSQASLEDCARALGGVRLCSVSVRLRRDVQLRVAVLHRRGRAGRLAPGLFPGCVVSMCTRRVLCAAEPPSPVGCMAPGRAHLSGGCPLPMLHCEPRGVCLDAVYLPCDSDGSTSPVHSFVAVLSKSQLRNVASPVQIAGICTVFVE